MKTRFIVLVLLIFLGQLLTIAPVFAQKDATIPGESVEELAQEVSKLNKAVVEFQEWFMTLTPEEQQKAMEKLIEEIAKINQEIKKENPDLEIDFK